MATDGASGLGHLSPDGSPHGSQGAVAKDGAEMARKMIQAAETAAQAASATASAIEMFRRQAETGSSSSRSMDWFKLLPKPNVFDPRDYDQEVAMWREWWWSVTYTCAPWTASTTAS